LENEKKCCNLKEANNLRKIGAPGSKRFNKKRRGRNCNVMAWRAATWFRGRDREDPESYFLRCTQN
jgi:hypothetical protein